MKKNDDKLTTTDTADIFCYVIYNIRGAVNVC